MNVYVHAFVIIKVNRFTMGNDGHELHSIMLQWEKTLSTTFFESSSKFIGTKFNSWSQLRADRMCKINVSLRLKDWLPFICGYKIRVMLGHMFTYLKIEI
jgi:hypothetical protein